jgi:hypothetical protein
MLNTVSRHSPMLSLAHRFSNRFWGGGMVSSHRLLLRHQIIFDTAERLESMQPRVPCCTSRAKRGKPSRGRELARYRADRAGAHARQIARRGLVERRSHPNDCRVRTLWLKAAAMLVVERILEINLAIREEAFAGLGAGTTAACRRVIGKPV